MIAMNKNFLKTYVGLAPLALAIERSMECELLTQMPFKRPILDIGCGDGLFAKILFAERIDTGIDPNAIELASAKNLDAYVDLLECRGDAVPRPDASYRTVFSNSVLEHIPNLKPVLREVHRLLLPGGIFYVTVPSDRFEQYAWISRVLVRLNLSSLQTRFRIFYNRFWRHYHCYAPECWAQLLKECGFEVVTVRSYAPRAICTFNDLLAPFAAVSLVTKRATNRWTLFPKLRRVLFAPLIAIVGGLLRDADPREGGLVFLAVRKP
jgi:SAM-dependent methyltransferase